MGRNQGQDWFMWCISAYFTRLYQFMSMMLHASVTELGPYWFRFTPVRCQAIIYINDDFWSTIFTMPRDILQWKNVRNQPNSITIFHLKSSLLILPQLCTGGDDVISRSICLVLKCHVYKCCIPYPVWYFFISADWSIEKTKHFLSYGEKISPVYTHAWLYANWIRRVQSAGNLSRTNRFIEVHQSEMNKTCITSTHLSLDQQLHILYK